MISFFISLGFLKVFGVFLCFSLFHSICAHEIFKNALGKFAGEYFVKHFWRILYCAISFYMYFHLYPSILFKETLPYRNFLIHIPFGFEITLMMRLTGIFIVYLAFFQSDYLEFIGIKQCYRGIIGWFKKTDEKENLFGTHRLEVKGIYRYIRHPMLIGGWLALWTPSISLPHLLTIVFFTLYICIGKYFEDKRLRRVFGASFEKYEKEVNAFFPTLRSPYGTLK